MSQEFIDLYKDVADYTLLTPDRLWYLWTLPRSVVEEKVEGDFAEVGVYKGGSAKMIYQSVHGQRAIHLFDTFEGVPQSQVSERDYHTKNFVYEDEGAKGLMSGGVFAASEEEVAELFRGKENVTLYKGIFPDTSVAVEDKTFAFVYLDADLYEPTKAGLNFFYEKLSQGGIIVVDDYGHLNGVTQAVKEFAEEKEVKAVQSAFMQCVIRKPLIKEGLSWDPSNILWQFGG